MTQVIEGNEVTNPMIREWISKELGQPVPENCRCLGVMKDDDDGNPELIAGIAFHDFKGFMVDGSLASSDPAWLQKGTLQAFMGYPFERLGVTRFHSTCAKSNKKMRRLFERLGFKYEGCARKAFDGEQDAMIYSLLRDENKWIN